MHWWAPHLLLMELNAFWLESKIWPTLCNTLVGAGARNQDKITIEATGGGAWAPSTESSHLPFCCTTASVPLLSVQLLHNNWCASVQCKCTVHVKLKHVSAIRWLWPDAKWKDSPCLRWDQDSILKSPCLRSDRLKTKIILTGSQGIPALEKGPF